MELRNKTGQTEAEFLASYDPTEYEHPAVTVDIMVFTLNTQYQPCVLLIRRGNHPHIGKLALPGGFVEIDEGVRFAAKRELFEETSISDLPLCEVGVFGNVGRDVRYRNISVSYACILPKDTSYLAGDDAEAADLHRISLSRKGNSFTATLDCCNPFSVEKRILPLEDEYILTSKCDLAFDHAEILFRALATLAKKDAKALAKLVALPDVERSSKTINEFFSIFSD